MATKKGSISLSLLASALVASSSLVAGNPTGILDQDAAPQRHPVMRFTPAALQRHHMVRESLPKVINDPSTHFMLQQAQLAGATGTVNLLPYFAYTPSSWNQGSCGDCWAWGTTAMVSIDAAVHGNRTLFSTQWFNSSYYETTNSTACDGGDSATYASWYASHPKFIPWSNTNAGFADSAGGNPHIASSAISTNPNFPVTSITNRTIVTTGVSQAQAIANIKAVLNNNQAVAFSYFLSGTGWNDFFSFWDTSSENTKWANIDKYNGFAWDSQAGGHLVCCVGYDDTDGTWIILNSWGSSSGRPDGYFKIPQAMGYGDYFTDGSTRYNQYEFDVFDIVWPNSPNSVSASITNPSANVTLTSGSNQAFAGTGTDSASGQTLTYSWNFGDGGTATGASASHTFTNTSSSPVTYTVKLTATDGTGASGSATRQVTVNPIAANKVTASISTPSSNVAVNSGSPQSFAGSATDTSSTATLSYAWNFGDGSSAAGASASHTYTNSGTSPVTYTATFTATDNTGASGTATRQVTVNPVIISNKELIQNGGFESGSANWAGTTGDIGSWSAEAAHGGTKCAWLCGNGSTASENLSQSITIPSTATSATLTFWMHVDTAETTSTYAYDTLKVQVINGTSTTTLATYSNLNKNSGYVQKTFDLSAFKGKTISLKFLGAEDYSLQTSFVIDDASVKVQ